jgi:excisionase family DNA binding protein
MAKRKGTPVEELITVVQAADLLGITKRHVLRLIASGEIEGRQLASRAWLVNRASLANWTPKRRRKPKEPKQ